MRQKGKTMKRFALIVFAVIFGQVVMAESTKFPYSWMEVQTDNYGWSWSGKGGLVGYVIDDQSRSNLPSSMRFYSGTMTLEFNGTSGVFTMYFKTVDCGVHYDENIVVRAYNDDNQISYVTYKVDDNQQKHFRVEFADAGLHRIVIRGGYHRIFSQNGSSRGCVTTFSGIKWRPDSIQVPRSGKLINVPCSWLEEHCESKMLMSCENDYLDQALGVGQNGCALVDSYVAGLDPTDPESTFKTMIEFNDGKPVVSWEPALNGLDENGRCKKTGVRTYRVLGSTDLKTWSEVDDGEENKFNFFRVNVEMP